MISGSHLAVIMITAERARELTGLAIRPDTREVWTCSAVLDGQGVPLMPGCCPAGTDGAAGATTDGVNLLPPVGSRFFSVGDTVVVFEGALVLVDVSGEAGPDCPHAVAARPTTISAVAVHINFMWGILWSTSCFGARQAVPWVPGEPALTG